MEKHIVYIAGDPSNYPLEYYDKDSRSYQGVVPELLSRFSEQSRYDVRYYAPEKGDQRESLAADQQVDIVSCPEDIGAIRHRTGEDILLLEDDGSGRAAALCLLDVAPDGLAGELRSFLSGISREELNSLVIQAARSDPPQSRRMLRSVFGGLALAVVVLAAALTCVIVSARRKLKKLRRSQEQDPVTGLGNRDSMERYFRTYLNDQNRILYTMFCFCLDPRGAGEEDETAALRHTAVILQDCASDTDILARVSDNGFALLRLSTGEREASEWLDAVLDRLREETGREDGGRAPEVTAGVCPLKPDDQNLDGLISRGLWAAQDARQEGTAYRFFSGETRETAQEERRLRADAQAGLRSREFQLYLQFYADAHTGRAVGAEVTVLWEHPERGLLPASRWLSLLEQEGLAGRLDGYVLERECAFLDFLRQKGREDFFLLYRLSEQTLSSGSVETGWKDILADYHVNCGQLLFGVPQSAVGGNPAGGGVESIRSLGMGLVLDDFDGQMTGLLQTGDVRFCGVKLNREFAGRAETPLGRLVLESVFQTGHRLGLAFLVKDVVSEDQAGHLRRLGCDLLCGDLYAPPLPAWEAMKKLGKGLSGKETISL